MFTHSLRSSDFEVTTVQDRYGRRSVDTTIIQDCADRGDVVVTNDRNFVRMAEATEHAGVVMYTDRSLLVESPTTAVQAIAEIDRYYSPDEIRGLGSTTGSEIAASTHRL